LLSWLLLSGVVIIIIVAAAVVGPVFSAVMPASRIIASDLKREFAGHAGFFSQNQYYSMK